MGVPLPGLLHLPLVEEIAQPRAGVQAVPGEGRPPPGVNPQPPPWSPPWGGGCCQGWDPHGGHIQRHFPTCGGWRWRIPRHPPQPPAPDLQRGQNRFPRQVPPSCSGQQEPGIEGMGGVGSGQHRCGGVHLSSRLSRRALLTGNGWSPRVLPAAAVWLPAVPRLTPGGPCSGLTPLRGPSLGATAPGKREARAERAEEKGSEKRPRGMCHGGAQQMQVVGGWGALPHLYSSVSGLGRGTGAMKDVQSPRLQSPSPGQGHPPGWLHPPSRHQLVHRGGILAGTGGPLQLWGVGARSRGAGAPVSTGQQGHGQGTGVG